MSEYFEYKAPIVDLPDYDQNFGLWQWLEYVLMPLCGILAIMRYFLDERVVFVLGILFSPLAVFWGVRNGRKKQIEALESRLRQDTYLLVTNSAVTICYSGVPLTLSEAHIRRISTPETTRQNRTCNVEIKTGTDKYQMRLYVIDSDAQEAVINLKKMGVRIVRREAAAASSRTAYTYSRQKRK